MIARPEEVRRSLARILRGTEADQERRARITWSRLRDPDDSRARRLIGEHGYAGALLELERPVEWATRFHATLVDVDVDRDEEIAERLRARILTPADDEWPASLDELEVPVGCLWVRGEPDLDAAVRRAAAVVGARASTSYGEMQAAEISAGLVERRFTVVSGGAYGIDAAAHRGALAADGLTIALLASGIDRPYPAGNRALLEHIGEVGLLVTESPPGYAPTRRRFLTRNRVIAALGQGTLVVEAAMRSGTLRTVNDSIALGRPVGALPGPVTSMASSGCHDLIREQQAVLVRDAADCAELFGAYGEDLAPDHHISSPLEGLGPAARAVHDALPVRAASDVPGLARRCSLEERIVLVALGELELLDLAVRDGAGWRRVPAPRRSSEPV